ncbi:cytochrome P450 [Collybia nuda]|uniref:Cytochrome P450 n=1 Tax=Collybia nuda TaxID=64659 RepID=A0A9P5XRR2_9AGAR|nr:cytochrome P450 [Collybia nuda]
MVLTLLITTFVVFSGLVWLRSLRSSPVHKLPGPPSPFGLTGHLRKLVSPHGASYHFDLARRYGSLFKFKGVFGQDGIYVSDPRALHHITVSNLDCFSESPVVLQLNKLALGDGLLTTYGAQHRKQRKMLNPLFSIRHLRSVTESFHSVCDQLVSQLCKPGYDEVDINDLVSRAALEMIGCGGLGTTFNSFSRTAEPGYVDYAKNLFPTATRINFLLPFLPLLTTILPANVRRFLVDYCIPFGPIKDLRDIINQLEAESIQILKKKYSESSNNGVDIISLLLRVNAEASADDRLSEKEIIAQMTTLTFAAFETTSGAICRIIDLLSLYPDKQERLREELLAARRTHGVHMDYEALHSLPFLDAIIRESLRVAVKDTILPLTFAVKSTESDTEITSVTVPKSTMVYLGIAAANVDKRIWGEDAEQWIPERWLFPLPDSISAAHMPSVYSNIMTFMGGPRACIGFKYSELEMKVVLSRLFSDYKFSPATGKEVIWMMGGTMYPAVRGADESKSRLPILVTPAASIL